MQRAQRPWLLAWAVFSLLACDEQDKPVKPVVARPVARLAKMSGEVSHRSVNEVAWKGATRGMALHNRDAIKTGKGAGAVVRFLKAGDKLQLEIEEQSLVIIEAPEERRPSAPGKGKVRGKPRQPTTVARVEQGTVRGVARPGAPPVSVVTPQGKTQIRAEGTEAVPFRVRLRKGGKLEVAVLKGRARVSSGRSEVSVAPRQVVDIKDDTISKPVELLPYPVLVAPPVDDTIAAGSAMELRWTPVPGAAVYRVQISTEVSFADRLYDTTVTTAMFKLPAPKAQQTYVWRVASVDPAGRESEFGYARRFHVTSAEVAVPGQLLHPPDNTGLQLIIGKRSPVLFRWKGEGERYELVVARDPGLKRRVVARRRTDQTEEVLTSLRRGTYYWGVYGIDGEGKQARRTPLFKTAYKLVIARRRPPYVRVPKAIKWK